MGNTFSGTKNTVSGTVLGDTDFPPEWGAIVPDGAFQHRLDVVEVELPSWIKKIGRCAFYGCSNLEEIVIPPEVKVGKMALQGCLKLQATTVLGEVDFPDEWDDTVPDGAFQHRLDVVKVELPSRIKKIGRCAFNACKNLEECVVPPGVEVTRDSFLFCGNVKF